MKKLIDGSNNFNERDFNTMCEELEKGNEIEVYINCIGFTRNNMEQEHYREALENKYGYRLIITGQTGYNAYSYSYKLEG